MIDKITITLDDTGRFVVDAGEVQVHTVQKVEEVLYLVNHFVKKLAYFPQNISCGANPVAFEEFEKQRKVEKKQKKP